MEALGFDSVWCGDHVSFNLPLYESLTLLASYASITERIKLGSAVYLLALRPPAMAAKVDRHPRRALRRTADLRRGRRRREPEASSPPSASPTGSAGPASPRAIDVVRTLWRDTPASFKGRFTEFEGVSIDPKPVQQPGPPIWIGGRSDAALMRAARQGDGWVSYVVTARALRAEPREDPRRRRPAGQSLEGSCAAHLAFITVGRDYESAREASG